MRTKFSAILLFLVLFINYSHAQENSAPKEKIAAAVSDYFDLDRESIHAQFNKKVFFSSEQIWFKGYVFNKKITPLSLKQQTSMPY